MTSAVTIAMHKLIENDTLKHVVHFLGLGASAPTAIDIIVSFVAKHLPDFDEDMTAADIAKCSLLIPLVPDDSPRTLIKMHQVVHDVFKNYILDTYCREEVAVLTRRDIETLSPFAEHNLLQFDLEFHISSKLMAPPFKSLSTYLQTGLRMHQVVKDLYLKPHFLTLATFANSVTIYPHLKHILHKHLRFLLMKIMKAMKTK